jgi:hypothetical protein
MVKIDSLKDFESQVPYILEKILFKIGNQVNKYRVKTF